MQTLWFIIYMTFSGWGIVQIDAHPALEERCYGNEASQFCIVSVERPIKTSQSLDKGALDFVP